MSDLDETRPEPTGEHAGFIRIARFRAAEIRQNLAASIADLQAGKQPPPPTPMPTPTAEPEQLGLLETDS